MLRMLKKSTGDGTTPHSSSAQLQEWVEGGHFVLTHLVRNVELAIR